MTFTGSPGAPFRGGCRSALQDVFSLRRPRGSQTPDKTRLHSQEAGLWTRGPLWPWAAWRVASATCFQQRKASLEQVVCPARLSRLQEVSSGSQRRDVKVYLLGGQRARGPQSKAGDTPMSSLPFWGPHTPFLSSKCLPWDTGNSTETRGICVPRAGTLRGLGTGRLWCPLPACCLPLLHQ